MGRICNNIYELTSQRALYMVFKTWQTAFLKALFKSKEFNLNLLKTHRTALNKRCPCLCVIDYKSECPKSSLHQFFGYQIAAQNSLHIGFAWYSSQISAVHHHSLGPPLSYSKMSWAILSLLAFLSREDKQTKHIWAIFTLFFFPIQIHHHFLPMFISNPSTRTKALVTRRCPQQKAVLQMESRWSHADGDYNLPV